MEKTIKNFSIGMIIMFIISIIILIIKPEGAGIEVLNPSTNPYNFVLFGLGLNSTVLIIAIGIFLILRWAKSGKNNISLLIWGISFLCYSLTFIAHIFRAFGIADANENTSPGHFLLYRFVMIIWAAGIIYGLLVILTENKKAQRIPSICILIVGFLIFILCLFVFPISDATDEIINNTMYIFLFTIWIPICFAMAYFFYHYGKVAQKSGPKIISLGFYGLMLTYMAWAPWHSVAYIYFIAYFLFNLSLVPILIGFIILSKED